jgi:Ca2+-binding EF-hand superfamily protein
MTDADLVRATFRLWDKDGNGVVSKQENRTDA